MGPEGDCTITLNVLLGYHLRVRGRWRCRGWDWVHIIGMR